MRAAGHGDLIETAPAVASAASRVASRTHAVRDLLRDHLPGAMVTPGSLQPSDGLEG